MDLITYHLGTAAEDVDHCLDRWESAKLPARLWRKDPTLWSGQEVPELADRLGWLDLPAHDSRAAAAYAAVAADVAGEGFRDVVLLGMGGSSLAPDVFASVLRPVTGYPRLRVLDSTHPAAVAAVAAAIDPGHTLFVVASKSGTTIETMSLFRYFWEKTQAVTERPGRHFVAISDPGTPLVALAHERGFREWFPTPADVGGRFSALTAFGLVPAALTGASPVTLLDRAAVMAELCGPEQPVPDNPGLVLGAVMASLWEAGRDKVQFLTSPALATFPAWLEQLIAESLGKDGKGIVPVTGAPLPTADTAPVDRWYVYIYLKGEEDPELERRLATLADHGHPVIRMGLEHRAEIVREMFLWEVAVAVAAIPMLVHPFNQPNVQAAKQLAKEAMADASAAGELPALAPDDPGLAAAVAEWLDGAGERGYIALLAFLPPSPELDAALARLQALLAARTGRAVTAAVGPRYLHSTGQLHKGGPAGGIYLQLVDDPAPELPVPETDYSFARLVRAQADGDARALQDRERPLLRVRLEGEPAAEVAFLAEKVTAVLARG